MKWVYDRLTKPDLLVKEKKYNKFQFSKYQRSKSYSHRSVALAGTRGDWNLKLPWIQSIIGDGTRILYVVRDPRAWVAHVLNNDLFDDIKDSVMEALHSSKCLFKKNYAWQF